MLHRRFRFPRPPLSLIVVLGRLQCLPLFPLPTWWAWRIRWLLSRVPVLAPPLLRRRVLRPLRCVSRPRIRLFPWRELGCGVARRIVLVSSPRFAVSAQPAWDNPPPFTYGFSEPSHLPAQDFYPDDPGEEFYSEVSDASSASDELGQAAVNLLRKYLDQIYDPASAQPSGVTSASVSDSGFFRPPPSSQSGISVPSDFLTEFDRVAASAIPKPTPPVSAALAFPVSDVQAQSHFVTEIPSPGLLALGDEAFGGNPLKTKSFP